MYCINKVNKTMLRFLFKSQLRYRNALPIYIALKTQYMHIKKNIKIGCSYMRSFYLPTTVFHFSSPIHRDPLKAETTEENAWCRQTVIL